MSTPKSRYRANGALQNGPRLRAKFPYRVRVAKPSASSWPSTPNTDCSYRRERGSTLVETVAEKLLHLRRNEFGDVAAQTRDFLDET